MTHTIERAGWPRRLLLTASFAAAAVSLAACGGGAADVQARSQPLALAQNPATRPNILLIVADDMGYSDIGAFGSEIATPNIDALVRDGRVLTRFYTAPACSPTRGMLMSGADSHRVGFGAMENNVTAFIRMMNAPFGVDFGYDTVPDGYAGHLTEKALSMPKVFRDAGYHTYMAGKWHLAYEFASTPTGGESRFRPAAYPNKMGFERSYAMLNGVGSHFAPVPGNPTRYDNTTYTEDDVEFTSAGLPADFYSTKNFTDKLISYIEGNRADGRPFFAFAAYTSPHWPLQAPDEDIAAQKGRYDEGYDVIRARRVERMKQLGVIPQGFVDNPGLQSVAEGGTGKKRWSELSAHEKALQARAMEVYAAMVSNLDGHIGRLVQYLRDTGQYDNTLIFFMSDNGSDSNPAAGANVTPSTDLASMGRPGSTIAYGERWAEVSAAPFRLWKTFTGAEGSVSVPAVIKLPGRGLARRPLTAATQVKDLLPTFLDIANVPIPTDTYKGQPIEPITGVSLRTALQSNAESPQVRPPNEAMVMEYLGQGYVHRRDGWKLSRTTVPGVPAASYADVPWRLFNMNDDRAETRDMAAQRPDIVEALKKKWDHYVNDNNVLVPATPPAAKRDPASL